MEEGLSHVTRRAEDRSWRRWALRLGAALAMAALIAYLPYHLVGGSTGAQLEGVEQELDRVRAEIAVKRADNAELRRDNEGLKNDTGAIEDIARRDLGMVRPGDLILRFEASR